MLVWAFCEVLALIVPCVIGILKFNEIVKAPGATIDTLDFTRLGDIISLWTLVSILAFCGVRLIGDGARHVLSSVRPLPVWRPRYDRAMVKALLVLVGMAGLVFCDPLGERVADLFLDAARALRPPPVVKPFLGFGAFFIQLGVTSMAMVVVVKHCSRLFSWYLRTGIDGLRDDE